MKFKAIPVDEGEYKYFVIMCSEEKPCEVLEKIEKKLRTFKKGKGKVLFDLTLGNLDKDTRYIEAYFDGKNIDIWSFKIVKNVPQTLLKRSFDFLSKHYQYVENSILTSAEKFKYKKQIFV